MLELMARTTGFLYNENIYSSHLLVDDANGESKELC